jgi:glycosyltransferase involved in cell wall biosynthesis
MGLRKASGDYITIADHDDEWHSERILSQLRLTDKAPIITSGYTLINSESGKHTHRFNTSPGTDELYFV